MGFGFSRSMSRRIWRSRHESHSRYAHLERTSAWFRGARLTDSLGLSVLYDLLATNDRESTNEGKSCNRRQRSRRLTVMVTSHFADAGPDGSGGSHAARHGFQLEKRRSAARD